MHQSCTIKTMKSEDIKYKIFMTSVEMTFFLLNMKQFNMSEIHK